MNKKTMMVATKKPSDAELERERVAGLGPSRVTGETVKLSLQTLRDVHGKTQAQVADESDIAQGDISKLEARESLDEVQVSTLRRYVEALGGDFSIVATIGGRRYEIVPAASDVETTAAFLRLERKRAGLTHEQLAERMFGDWTAADLRKAESGHAALHKKFIRFYLDGCRGVRR